MEFESVSCVYFSPTGSTKKIVETIARGMSAGSVSSIDLTLRSGQAQHPWSFHKGLVILGTPVYYGRVPEEAASRFSTLSGRQTLAVLVVSYGNRAVDDALLELRDLAVNRGFVPVAAGAFPAEHSYSSEQLPMAKGRPDESDLGRALAFGTAVRKKVDGLQSVEKVGALAVPGQFPYLEPINLMLIKRLRATTPVSFTPETDMEKCTECGLCAQVCPTGAIPAADLAKTDRQLCILCFACVKECPVAAREMRIPQWHTKIQEVAAKCQKRQEPVVFI